MTGILAGTVGAGLDLIKHLSYKSTVKSKGVRE
nr:MAG TPA: hypothetical protein [Caudoviricetes sp.]